MLINLLINLLIYYCCCRNCKDTPIVPRSQIYNNNLTTHELNNAYINIDSNFNNMLHNKVNYITDSSSININYNRCKVLIALLFHK